MLYNDCVCVSIYSIIYSVAIVSFQEDEGKNAFGVFFFVWLICVIFQSENVRDNGTINNTYENSYSFSEYQETKVTFDAKKNHPRIKCLLFHVLEPVKIHLLMYRRIKSRRIVIIITNIILVFPSKRKRSDFSILFSPFFSACLPC